MIKLEHLTPEVYYKQSRDFQFIGRLYDAVLNSIMTNTKLINSLPFSDNINEEYLDLLTLTLGFKPKHKYNTKHLRALCSILSEVLHKKGTIQAILDACQAVINIEGILTSVNYDISADNLELTIYMPQEISDLQLLIDLLDYLLPAGMLCNIVREFRFSEKSNTNIGILQKVTAKTTDANSVSSVFNPNNIVDKQSVLSEKPLGDTPGTIINSTIWNNETDTENSETEQGE